MKHPHSEGVYDAFIKFFEHDKNPRSMLNEMVAYSVAQKLRMPVAETFPCSCATQQLLGRLPWVQDLPADEFTRCIASLTVGRLDRSANSEPREKFLKRIAMWNAGPVAAIGDELTINSDRHQNNFLITEDGKTILIDHEKCLGGPNCSVDELVAIAKYPCPGNYIARTILDSENEIAKKRLSKFAEDVVYGPRFTRNDFPGTILSAGGIDDQELGKIVATLNYRMQRMPMLISAQLEIESRLAARTT